MIFLVIFSFFGLVIVFRNVFRVFTTYFSTNWHEKLKFISILLVFSLLFFLFSKEKDVFIFIFFCFSLFSFFFVPIMHFFLEKKLKDNFCHFLDEMILYIKTGKSFHTAFLECIEKSDAFMQQKMRNVLGILEYHDSKSIDELRGFSKELVFALKKVKNSNDHQLIRLEEFRRKLKIESDFRHRSGQATAQIKIQAIFLVGIYIALLFLGSQFFSRPEISYWQALSLPLFLLGVFLMIFLGRRFQWKV